MRIEQLMPSLKNGGLDKGKQESSKKKRKPIRPVQRVIEYDKDRTREYLTETLVKLIGISRVGIYLRIKQGAFPKSVTGGGSGIKAKWSPESIHNWIDSNNERLALEAG